MSRRSAWVAPVATPLELPFRGRPPIRLDLGEFVRMALANPLCATFIGPDFQLMTLSNRKQDDLCRRSPVMPGMTCLMSARSGSAAANSDSPAAPASARLTPEAEVARLGRM